MTGHFATKLAAPAEAHPAVDGCRKSAGVTGTVSFSAPAFLAMNCPPPVIMLQ